MIDTVHSQQAPAWRNRAVTVLLGLLPACFCIQFPLKNAPVAVAFLAGIALVFLSRFTRQSYGLVRFVWLVFLLRVAVNLVNAYSHHLKWSDVDLTSQILAFVAIAGLFSVNLDERLFWRMLNLTAILLGGASLYQRYAMGVDRPYGLNGTDWGAIEYAMITLALTMFSVVQLWRKELYGRIDRVLFVAGVVLGFLGALLTQSRGPLIAFPLTLMLLFVLHARRQQRWTRTGLTVLALIAVIGAATTVLDRKIVERFADVHTEMRSYSPDNASGAVRERLEMWRTAWRAFGEHPLAGVGIDRFGDYSATQIAQGKTNASIAKYEHAHSEYLEAMATGGIPGFVSLLLILFVPLAYFWRRLGDASDTVFSAALTGIATIAIYALCALTDNVFYRPMPQSFFLLSVLGMALWIARQQQLARHRA